MDKDIVIKVQNISKVYKMYNKPVDRLKESINLFGRMYHKEFYAIKDLSFDVKKGETIGIIGKNGSGKSTLLKIITGVLTPTTGTLTVNGKVSALLELGAGFNPELTGIENIYLHGTILGYKKQEIDERLDAILSFADIGEFINQPVKTYSSGMFVRLAFAVAINVEPDILIVDEALSVGDMRFQKKCLEKIDNIRESGKTIIFCSHDMHAVSELCEKVLWLKNGVMEDIGYPNRVIASFISMMTETESKIKVKSDSNFNKNPNYFIRNSEEVEIISVKLFDKDDNEKNVFFTGDKLVFDITYNAIFGIQDPNYSVIIFRNDKVPVGICKTNFDKNLPSRGFVKGISTFRCNLKNIQLNKGNYTFGISIWDKAKRIIFANNVTKEFEIRSFNIVFGPTEEKCVYFPENEWKF